MKKTILFIILIGSLHSCAFDRKGFEFDNFKNTPLRELAKAVRGNDGALVKELLKFNKDIDYKEPVYQQTLLTLAIVNRKKEAFIELLKANANPNVLLGGNKDSTPLTEAIIHLENCDLFYIDHLLKYKANPNLAIFPEDKKHYFTNGYPLLTACIYNGSGTGNYCIDVFRLLVQYGADINCCNTIPVDEDICEGDIHECLMTSSMENLRYFVIEKKIKIPQTVFIIGGIDKATEKKYSLSEILNTEDYQFEDFVRDNEKVDRSKSRKIRNEILEYLKKTGQE